MLNPSDTFHDAYAASKTMPGVSVELIDALTRFSGRDMRKMAQSCPEEFADLHEQIRKTTNLIVVVTGLDAIADVNCAAE